MQATQDIPRTTARFRTASRTTASVPSAEGSYSKCRVCADCYGRLIAALARFHTVEKIASLCGEERSCLHDRLAGTEPIQPVSWKALSRVATRLKLSTAPATCPQCGTAIVTPA